MALSSSATDNTLRQMARLYMRVSRDRATLAGHTASAMTTTKPVPAEDARRAPSATVRTPAKTESSRTANSLLPAPAIHPLSAR